MKDAEGFVKAHIETGDERDGNEPNIIVASKVLPDRIHLLPTGGKPIFPGLMFPVVMGEGPEAEVLKKVNETAPQKVLGFVLPKKQEPKDGDEDSSTELHRMGTAAKILRLEEQPDGTVQALCQGQRRFEILKVVQREEALIGQVVYPEDILEDSDEVKALGMSIINSMRDLIQHNPLFSEEIKMFLSRADWGDPGKLADFSVTMTASTGEELQDILEALNVQKRLEKALFLLRKELDLNELKEKITHQIEEKISQQQREFFLREQLKAIKKELGLEKDEKEEEIDKYRERIEGLDLPEEAQQRIEEELEKLKLLSPQSPEFAVSRNYLDWLTGLPWGTHTKDMLNVRKARRILDRDHYGLDDVKKRILEFIGVAKLKGSVEGSILCLVGPPGVGKTSLGKGIAEALGREFFRFSLGGMRDEAEIKGHRRTYIGAMPGKVMQAIKNTGSANPVIMLDEIDKLAASFQGDPASALLEVLDPEQNSSFRDHYLDVPFDLSKVLFIATANVPDTIPGPLFDRMEVMNLSGYILQEKVHIARRHLVPKQLERNGLTADDIAFTNAALKTLVTGYAREAGVRNLEKAIGTCMRQIAAGKAAGTVEEKVTVEPDTVEKYLGKPRFLDDPLMKRGRAGVVMGLAWTSMGGATLYVEAQAIPGKADFKLTGQLGDVMKESAAIALSVVTANAKRLGIDPEFFKKHTVHIHVPAGATPKDGPSAGITMASALVSLAINRRAQARWAMTGELTLTGRVLPIGGVKEKVIAAKRSKVKNVILPMANQKDFEEIPENVRRGITAHFVEDYSEVFALLFPEKRPSS